MSSSIHLFINFPVATCEIWTLLCFCVLCTYLHPLNRLICACRSGLVYVLGVCVCVYEFFWSVCPGVTCEVAVLLALGVGEGDELSEQQRVLEHSLHRLDEVGLQGGGVLLSGVPRLQELLERLICLCWEREREREGKIGNEGEERGRCGGEVGKDEVMNNKVP